ncbi:type II secretion system protein [Rugamonas sp. CCM 8940]|uniref:type II secretion system protein n=1 Tax=Rugamonas sp. CCM 8940 TaxID=2765359 RepID=UPI0018F55DF9|nr:type II secretion system protein [Rugamonas sp. CCM 8940]MBJ7309618.1 type II secretion system protein [Rugamonas sp. CCM 8940]
MRRISAAPSATPRAAARGFAYLWTLLLVAFMGVGLVVASGLFATAARRDKERELIFIGHEFRAAIERYQKATGNGAINGQNQYPLRLEDLLKDPRFANPRRHLRRLYADPMSGKAEWGLVLQQGRIVGVHSLSDKVPLKQDNFDEDDAAALRRKTRYADWLFTYPADLFTPQKDGLKITQGGQPAADPPRQN